MLASIEYENSNGKKIKIITDRNWSCDGKHATEQQPKGTSTIWKGLEKDDVSNLISDKAYWIWGDTKKNTMTCSIQLPEESIPEIVYGEIALGVDDNLNYIKVNKLDVDLTDLNTVANVDELHDWDKAKIIKTVLAPNDLVEINGTNTGGPAGIVATITYYDGEGRSIKINTNRLWSCSSNNSNSSNNNAFEQDSKGNNSTWEEFNHSDNSEKISDNAIWIWGDTTNATVTCSIVLPTYQEASKYNLSPGKITIGVDDVLNSIKVNNNNLYIKHAKGLSSWNVVKSFFGTFTSGDTIEINGTNKGGSGGIIVTIDYVDSKGVSKKFDSNKSWICDDKAANQLEKKSSTKTWKEVNSSTNASLLSNDAYWIWGNSKNSTTICKATLP